MQRLALLRRARHAQPLPHLQPLQASPRRHTCRQSSWVQGSATCAASTSASRYWTLAEPFTHEAEIKKSRFIATAWPVTSAAEAMEAIQSASDPTASHNCYAYKIGQQYRASDDGEPSGTAGRPILTMIEGDGLDGVAVLVVRHFGGTKLGAGGLVRAYGGTARDCLRGAPKVFVKHKVQLRISVPFEALGAVYNALAKCGGSVPGAEDYSNDGQASLTVMIDADASDALQDAVSNATSGRATVQLVTASS